MSHDGLRILVCEVASQLIPLAKGGPLGPRAQILANALWTAAGDTDTIVINDLPDDDKKVLADLTTDLLVDAEKLIRVYFNTDEAQRTVDFMRQAHELLLRNLDLPK